MSKFEQNWFWCWKDWSVIDHWWCLVSALCMIWIHVRFCFIRGGKLFQQWRLVSKQFIACMFGRYADLFPRPKKKHISSFNNALGKYIMNEYFYHPNHQVSRLFGSLVNITWRVWEKKHPKMSRRYVHVSTCIYVPSGNLD